MTRLPAVVASPTHAAGLLITQFEMAQQDGMRDAVGYHFRYKTAVDETPERRLIVAFSGTVFAVKLRAFKISDISDVESRFRVFAHAAIGDYLDTHGLEFFSPMDRSTVKVDCFSPHFQNWSDRLAADDDFIEQYIEAHTYQAWKYALPGFELGLADQLRLHRSFSYIDRLVSLGEQDRWEVKARTANGAFLTGKPSLIQAMRAKPSSKPATDNAQSSSAMPTPVSPADYVFVDEARISELKRITAAPYDFAKVVALCEELNLCYRSQCYYAVAALVRTLLDHVPPAFGAPTFAAVASNYKGGRSFKEVMGRLESTARSIGDMHLHTQIRSTESLPTRTQVNFANEVDVLLAELIRIASQPPASGMV